MSSPTAVLEKAEPTPAPAPALVEEPDDDPGVVMHAPVTTGLTAGQKKRAKKKAAARKGSTATPVEGTAESGTATPPGAAATPPPTPAPAPAISPDAPPERRLSPEEKAALGAQWGLAIDSEKFGQVLRSQQRLDYFQALSPEERAFATVAHIVGRKKLDAGLVAAHALEQRLLHRATVTLADYAVLEAKWQMERSAPQFKAALISEDTYQLFLSIAQKHRRIISATRIKKGTALTEAEVGKAEEKRLEIAEEERKAAAAEALLAKNAGKLATSKADFEKAATALRLRIAARVAAEIQDFVWAADFDASIATARGKVATGAAAARQASQAGDRADAAIDLAVKQRDVAASLADFARLDPATLREIKDDVLADSSQTAMDFHSRATLAMSNQRNPTEIATWVRWMQLDIYPASRTLTDREGLKVHFTISNESIGLPARVTESTTAAQLVSSLFTVRPAVAKLLEAHVSLETGVSAPTGEFKNPHKYWGDGAAEHELYFSPGHTPRWEAPLDEAQVRNALNEAMTEVRAQLLARAAVVLAQDGRGY